MRTQNPNSSNSSTYTAPTAKPRLSTLACLGFIIIGLIDDRPRHDVSLAEIHDAADAGNLLDFLEQRFGHHILFSWLTPASRRQLEQPLRDAAEAMHGRCPAEHSGLCQALAIVLEAIQQQYGPVFSTEPPAVSQADPSYSE